MNPEPEAPSPTPGATRPTTLLRRIGREPLFQFLLIGAVLFGGATAYKAAQRPVLRIDADDMAQLVSYWEVQTQRPPNPDELKDIIADRVDEEILAREAVRLGLDKDDIIVRRRLAQKMAFAGEDVAPIPEPDTATLQAWYDKTRSQYVAPSHMALQHLFFSANRPDARAAASAALKAAQAGGPAPTGDPFVLPLTNADATPSDLSRDYGPDFAQAAQEAPIGVWSGPVKSAYGWHILRIEGRSAAAVQPFADVRAEVRDAWIADRRRTTNADFMARLRKRYRVVVDNAAR